MTTTEITGAIALHTLRNTEATLGVFLKAAIPGFDAAQIANNNAGACLRALLGIDLIDICSAGKPTGRLNLNNREDVNRWRARLIAAGMRGSRAKEVTASELLDALNLSDLDRADAQKVFNLMRSPASEKDGTVKGFGDFAHYDGQAKGATYLVTPEAAQRFSFEYDDDPIYKERKEHAPGRRGRKPQEIVSLDLE